MNDLIEKPKYGTEMIKWGREDFALEIQGRVGDDGEVCF